MGIKLELDNLFTYRIASDGYASFTETYINCDNVDGCFSGIEFHLTRITKNAQLENDT